ncbi:MAG: LemA family protein [Actinomycetota bacterium]|nr:LemA family protein [Actinomycetota bacterium]PLS75331.1 MAG: LemA family protein [Actinomycetota bacterium]
MVASLSSLRSRRWFVPVAILAGVLLVVVLPLIGSYNGLVDREAAADQSFADLDAQLQRRNDLIPNLVAAVRGILNQEQAVFGELARARAAYSGATTPEQRFAASNQIEAGLGRLLAIVENFPQLRSSENVRDLQVQLEGTENRVAQARRDYNGAVTGYNAGIRRFPRSLVAGIFGFDRKPLFQANAGAREAPQVDLGNTPTTTPSTALR